MLEVLFGGVVDRRTILSDIVRMQQEIVEYKQKAENKKQVLVDLESSRKAKLEELEVVKVVIRRGDDEQKQILEVEEEMKNCDKQVSALQQQAVDESKAIQGICCRVI